MGLIEHFQNKTIFLDTAPIIYYIEENQQYIYQLDNLFNANNNGLFLFKTSVITLIEVLIHPLKYNNNQLVQQYQTILCNSKTLDIVDINIDIALQTAKLRGLVISFKILYLEKQQVHFKGTGQQNTIPTTIIGRISPPFRGLGAGGWRQNLHSANGTEEAKLCKGNKIRNNRKQLETLENNCNQALIDH